MTFCALLPWLIGIGAAILGGLIGWFLRRSRITELTTSLESRNRDYTTLRGEFDTNVTSYNSLQGQYNELDGELKSWRTKYNSLNLAFENHKDECTAQIEGYKTEISNTIALNDIVKGLRSYIADMSNGKLLLVP